jgi:hypothetical protein
VANVLARQSGNKQPIEEKKHNKMDAVGKEDGDIDNDGDEDESDEYLAKKRKAIGKAMKGEKNGGKEPVDTKPKMDEAKLRELDKSTLKTYVMKKKADIKRRDANTVTGRGKAVGDGGKDRYGLGDLPGSEKQRARDKSNVKLAKAKIAYKDANRDLKGPSSAGKKMAGESVVEYATNYMDERLKLGDPKRDSREVSRSGKGVPPSRIDKYNTQTSTSTSSGTGKPFHRQYRTVTVGDKGDPEAQKRGINLGVGSSQSRAQRAGKKDRIFKGEPEKERMKTGDYSFGGGDSSAKPKVNMKAKPKGKLPEDMSDAQMKRREEIVKELKKKSADFESRYGDKADAVMYATATKMAMKGK